MLISKCLLELILACKNYSVRGPENVRHSFRIINDNRKLINYAESTFTIEHDFQDAKHAVITFAVILTLCLLQ